MTLPVCAEAANGTGITHMGVNHSTWSLHGRLVKNGELCRIAVEAAPFLIGVMNEEFQTWTGRIIYLIGIMSATFHFGNGLWGFCISWGIIVGPKAQRNAGIAFMLVGLLLTVLGLATVVEFSLNPVPVEQPTIQGAM